MKKPASVDAFLASDPPWRAEAEALRPVLLDCGLGECIKWGKPCFVYGGANIAVMQPMKRFLSVLFTKGALLDDPSGLLEDQGPNTRSAKRLVFTSVHQVRDAEPAIRALVRAAIEAEERGLTVPAAPELVLVEELRTRLEADPTLEAAFRSLTPGRQREYHLHISSAKRAKARVARVEKHVSRIRQGKGLRDR